MFMCTATAVARCCQCTRHETPQPQSHLGCAPNTVSTALLTALPCPALPAGDGCRSKTFAPMKTSARCVDWQKLRVQELIGADQQQQGQVRCRHACH